jgi:hypothetical protein
MPEFKAKYFGANKKIFMHAHAYAVMNGYSRFKIIG